VTAKKATRTRVVARLTQALEQAGFVVVVRAQPSRSGSESIPGIQIGQTTGYQVLRGPIAQVA
jgi:hypothetical protein